VPANSGPIISNSWTGSVGAPIKMSPLCQFEMTLPADFPGGVWGDGSTDERWGVVAARGCCWIWISGD